MTRFDDDNRIERSLLRSLFFPSPSTLPPPLPVVMSTRLRNLAKAHWNLARGQHYQHRYHRRWQCFFYQRASSQASDPKIPGTAAAKRISSWNSGGPSLMSISALSATIQSHVFPKHLSVREKGFLSGEEDIRVCICFACK